MHCDVTIQKPYAVIGNGSVIANPSLMLRDYQEHFFVSDAVYQVFEAKTKSERVCGVGDETDLIILDKESPGKVVAKTLSPNGIRHLKALYAQYNPEPQYEIQALPAEYWYNNNLTEEEK